MVKKDDKMGTNLDIGKERKGKIETKKEGSK